MERATDLSQLEDAAVVGDLGGGTTVSAHTQERFLELPLLKPTGLCYLPYLRPRTAVSKWVGVR